MWATEVVSHATTRPIVVVGHGVDLINRLSHSHRLVYLANSVVMSANSASCLQVGPAETGSFPDNIIVRNCRQTGNEAGPFGTGRVGSWGVLGGASTEPRDPGLFRRWLVGRGGHAKARGACWEVGAWVVPGQRAGSGKAAAGFRIPRPSAGERVGRGGRRKNGSSGSAWFGVAAVVTRTSTKVLSLGRPVSGVRQVPMTW